MAGKKHINKPISFLLLTILLKKKKKVIMTLLLTRFYSIWDLDKLLGSGRPGTY